MTKQTEWLANHEEAMLVSQQADDGERQLGWYNAGHRIALDIARGLHFLHSLDVRAVPCAAHDQHARSTEPAHEAMWVANLIPACTQGVDASAALNMSTDQPAQCTVHLSAWQQGLESLRFATSRLAPRRLCMAT